MTESRMTKGCDGATPASPLPGRATPWNRSMHGLVIPGRQAGSPKSKAFWGPRVANPESVALGRWLWIPGSRAKARAPE